MEVQSILTCMDVILEKLNLLHGTVHSGKIAVEGKCVSSDFLFYENIKYSIYYIQLSRSQKIIIRL